MPLEPSSLYFLWIVSLNAHQFDSWAIYSPMWWAPVAFLVVQVYSVWWCAFECTLLPVTWSVDQIDQSLDTHLICKLITDWRWTSYLKKATCWGWVHGWYSITTAPCSRLWIHLHWKKKKHKSRWLSHLNKSVSSYLWGGTKVYSPKTGHRGRWLPDVGMVSLYSIFSDMHLCFASSVTCTQDAWEFTQNTGNGSFGV